MYFDFNQEKILEVAEEASKLGIELLSWTTVGLASEIVTRVHLVIGRKTKKNYQTDLLI